MSESSKMADLVLPACTSYEREEVHVLRGGRFFFSNQAIQPLGESKNDIEIIMGVMKKMGLKDEVLYKDMILTWSISLSLRGLHWKN